MSLSIQQVSDARLTKRASTTIPPHAVPGVKHPLTIQATRTLVASPIKGTPVLWMTFQAMVTILRYASRNASIEDTSIVDSSGLGNAGVVMSLTGWELPLEMTSAIRNAELVAAECAVALGVTAST